MRKPPVSLQSLLESVLGTVAQKTGSGALLTPIWRGIVGPLTARHAHAVSLTQGELLVRADAPGWRDELVLHEPELIAKLASVLGPNVVRSLRIEVE